MEKKFKKSEKPIVFFEEGYGITGATVKLNLAHLMFLKGMYMNATNAIKHEHVHQALETLERLLPFLQKFTEIPHPDDINLWEDEPL